MKPALFFPSTRFLGVLLSLAFSADVLAWGQIGHRVTGAIAEQYLTNEASANIRALLPNESLAEASTYADEMRSNPAEFWQEKAGPWHYVTVPADKTYADVGAPPQGDAFSALNQFRRTLLDERASLEEKQLALRFAVHIIGDLHQPLHAGNGTDRGGNDFRVKFFRNESNLHRVWDSQMIDRRQLSYTEWTEWLGNKITPEMVAGWQQTDPAVWIAESTAIRDTIYPEETDIGWDYLYVHLPTATRRLQQAGVRIAAYLNEVFAEQQN